MKQKITHPSTWRNRMPELAWDASRAQQMADLDAGGQSWCHTSAMQTIGVLGGLRGEDATKRVAYCARSTWASGLNSSQPQGMHNAAQAQSASVSTTKAEGFIWSAFANLNIVPKLGERCPSSRREMKLRSKSASKASFSCNKPRAKRNSRSTSPKASVGCRADGFVSPSKVGNIVQTVFQLLLE